VQQFAKAQGHHRLSCQAHRKRELAEEIVAWRSAKHHRRASAGEHTGGELGAGVARDEDEGDADERKQKKGADPTGNAEHDAHVPGRSSRVRRRHVALHQSRLAQARPQ
jgi:hypothetical protein